MKIAVSSQNRKTVTKHAGKCRKFWIYEVKGRQVVNKTLLELPLAQSFRACAPGSTHPLDEVNVLITGGIGTGLYHRFKQKGVLAVPTTEIDPDRAVTAWLEGALEIMPPQIKLL